jgi:hypothetical protein
MDLQQKIGEALEAHGYGVNVTLQSSQVFIRVTGNFSLFDLNSEKKKHQILECLKNLSFSGYKFVSVNHEGRLLQRFNVLPDGRLKEWVHPFVALGILSALIFGSGFLIIAIRIFVDPPIAPKVASPITEQSLSVTPSAQSLGLTLSAYSQLETGISYERATEIIGISGTERAKTELEGLPTTVIYGWDNPDGSNILATFQDNKLTTKAQAGLK